MVKLEKALPGSGERTVDKEADLGLEHPSWTILSLFSFGTSRDAGPPHRDWMVSRDLLWGVAPSPPRKKERKGLDGKSALGVSAWKLKWPDSDSETTEVLEADGFL